MPEDVRGKVIDFGHQTLCPILTEVPVPLPIEISDLVSRPPLADDHERDFVLRSTRPCRRRGRTVDNLGEAHGNQPIAAIRALVWLRRWENKPSS